jgi:hypothetical protein
MSVRAAHRLERLAINSHECQVCQLPGSEKNPLIDYVHAPGCMIYLPSGACNCSRPGFIAHKFRCPVEVDGDVAPRSEWMPFQ